MAGQQPLGEDEIAALHRSVDLEVAPLLERHRERLQCRLGCHACCLDGLTVFEVEARHIRKQHRQLLQIEAPHPAGKCAFLDGQGACRIYADRPYVCRTQGLPLRWLVEEDEDLLEYRDICPLNEAGPPLEELSEEHCWTIGPSEGQLAELQRKSGGKAMRRVALRDIWNLPLD